MTDTTAGSGSTAALLSTTVDAFVSTLSAVAPFVKGAGTVGAVISAIGTVLPIIVSTAKDLAPIVSSSISILRSNVDVTAEQLAALDAYEALIDADFDDALAFARANDAAVAAAAALKPAT